MNARLDPPSRRAVPRRRRGQSLTEAAVITFLVAVGTLGVVGLFGNNLRHLFGASADSIAGSTSAQNGGAKTSAGLLKWGMKGSGNLGLMSNPGATSNMQSTPMGPIMGNPGGTANMPAAE